LQHRELLQEILERKDRPLDVDVRLRSGIATGRQDP
jgi:hypothetical protein